MSEIRSFFSGDLGKWAAYHLLNAVIAPRPISWISTIASDGTLNLAPHSYTTVVSPDPPVVCFVSVGRKETLRNVESSGEFVYNVGNKALVDCINRTAADFPSNVSEFEWAGLTPIASSIVRAPRVAEAPVQMECRLETIYQVAKTSNFMVLGQVVAFHIAESLFVNDRVDTALLDPVGRLAGSLYAEMGEIFSIDRPTYTGLIDSNTKPLPRSSGS